MFERAANRWRTPRGVEAVLEYREGTVDWGVIESTLTGDEYGLRDLSLSGWALDLGAYLGSVTIALALDNPDLRVVAVEPVPENAQLCRDNVHRNGLDSRVTVIQGAVGPPNQSTLCIRYGFHDPELGAHYAFVGGIETVVIDGEGRSSQRCEARCYSLSDLIESAGELPSFVKIDCEGGEWEAFRDPVTRRLPRIHGEWHARPGASRRALCTIFAESHDVAFDGTNEGPGNFIAVRRGLEKVAGVSAMAGCTLGQPLTTG